MTLRLPDGRVIPDSERTRCDVYSRCVGYYRPVSDWNLGKQSEHRDRVPFKPTLDFGEEQG